MEKTLEELTENQLLKDQFAKIVIGAIAGFGARVLAEKGYDAVMNARRLKTALPQ